MFKGNGCKDAVGKSETRDNTSNDSAFIQSTRAHIILLYKYNVHYYYHDDLHFLGINFYSKFIYFIYYTYFYRLE
jgi:hypothetical protein